MKSSFLLGFLSLVFFYACAPTPRSIEYGNEECFYCKMAIVDAQHAAELVTSKGKVFVYDAIECMVAHYQKTADTEYAFVLVNDYEQPGTWLETKNSTFLISPQLPSPMGAYLNAFSSLETAKAMQAVKTGEILNWEALLQKMQE